MKSLVAVLHYKGLFRMGFLLPTETVGSAGDSSGACIVAGPGYEVRCELGESLMRYADGSLEVQR